MNPDLPTLTLLKGRCQRQDATVLSPDSDILKEICGFTKA